MAHATRGASLVGIQPADDDDAPRWSSCTILVHGGTPCGEPLPPDPPITACARHLRLAYTYCQTMIERATIEQIRAAGIKDSPNKTIRDKIRDDQSVVYYAAIGGLVKIGTTIYLDQRMKDLGANLLVTEKGDRELEAQRHRQFGHLLSAGREYFHPGPDLLMHVAELQMATAVVGPTAVVAEAAAPTTAPALPTADSADVARRGSPASARSALSPA